MATKDISDRQVCEAFAEARRRGIFADAILERDTGQPAKVVQRAMERACSRGLVEYGVTLRSGWLTAKGESLIARQSL